MVSFEHYLAQQNYAPSTQRRYKLNVEAFIQSNPEPIKCEYKDILNYLEELNKYTPGTKTRSGRLNAIKKYYDYLIETGQRETHPCKALNLKGNKKRKLIFTDLFSSDELEQLMNQEEKFAHLRVKNQLMMSLLIYQALMPQEVLKLKVQHVDLDDGTLYIQGGRVNMQRWLELHPRQYAIIETYLHETRPRLLQTSGIETDALLLNYRGRPVKVDDVSFIAERAKPLFPDRNLNTKAIRDSVLANMLNENRMPVEQVQLFAGHRWICSTLRCRQTPMTDQRAILNKYHPYE
ncbi:MAG: tyrosine-type recombinase/integrase [Bacteroidia bacterium]